MRVEMKREEVRSSCLAIDAPREQDVASAVLLSSFMELTNGRSGVVTFTFSGSMVRELRLAADARIHALAFLSQRTDGSAYPVLSDADLKPVARKGRKG